MRTFVEKFIAVESRTELDDTDVIENYTDTIMLVCEEYCELVKNKQK